MEIAMIWLLYKHELKNFVMGGKALMLLYILALLLFIEFGVGSMMDEIYTLAMGSSLFFIL